MRSSNTKARQGYGGSQSADRLRFPVGLLRDNPQCAAVGIKELPGALNREVKIVCHSTCALSSGLREPGPNADLVAS